MADALARLTGASFNGIRFPVETAKVDGGNGFAEHTAYRRPGADMEPTGRDPYKGTLAIPCINNATLEREYGVLFPDLLQRLIAEFEASPIGNLVHPTLGSFPAAIQTWSQELDPTTRNGVKLNVSFTEHNGSVSIAVNTSASTAVTNTDTVYTSAVAADTAAAVKAAEGAPVTGYTPMADTVSTVLDDIDESVENYSTVASLFRDLVSTVTERLDLPALLDAANYTVNRAVQDTLNAAYALQAAYGVGSPRQSIFTVPRVMSISDVAQTVYGNANLTAAILASNAIVSPLRIPAGTRLVILPLPGVTPGLGGASVTETATSTVGASGVTGATRG